MFSIFKRQMETCPILVMHRNTASTRMGHVSVELLTFAPADVFSCRIW
jgi:hypothetical protein